MSPAPATTPAAVCCSAA